MTPEAAIANLDRALARNGEDAILTRFLLGPNNSQIPISVTVRAMVRGFQPQDLIAQNGIIQGDSKVTISPTEIATAQWPGASSKVVGDQSIPKKGDEMVIGARKRTVVGAAPIYINGALVRIDVQVRG